jgi:hypothetical protein
MRPTKNASLITAGFYSALFTAFGGSWYFLFSLFAALAGGGDLGKVLGDTIIGCIVCWVFGTFVFYEIGKMFDDMNEEGRRRRDEREAAERNSRTNDEPKDNNTDR